MPSIFDTAEVDRIVQRIHRLKPDSVAGWGRMRVDQMLAHCQQPLRVGLGELKLQRSFIGLLFGGFAKRKLIADGPWKHDLPTDRHFIISGQRDFHEEQRSLIALLERFAARGPGGLPSDPHPFFGKLTTHEWGVLTWNHLDHHLRQFAV